MAVVFRAGELRHEIDLEARSVTQDAVGGESTTWCKVITVKANIEAAVGRELLSAQAMQIDQPTTITIRWQPAFSDPKAVAAMRAVFGSRIFNIHSSQNVEERNRLLVLIASEGLNDG